MGDPSDRGSIPLDSTKMHADRMPDFVLFGDEAFGFHFARFDSNVFKELIASKLKDAINPCEIKKLLLWEELETIETEKISHQGRSSRLVKYGSSLICILGIN